MANDITIYDNKALIDIADKYLKEDTNGLALPPNYDYKGAVSSLYLQCLSVKTSDGQPALSVCTKESIAKTVQDMLIKGLNPSKKQCYPIVYAVRDKDTKDILCWELQLQDSYFGKKKQVYTNNKEIAENGITGQCIYKNDIFETTIDVYGRKHIVKHIQNFENIKDSNIIGAYAVARFKDGTDMADVMAIDEIKKSWAMSRSRDSQTHANFPHEMAIKTVIGRLSKQLNNSTDDETSLTSIQDIENTNVTDNEYVINPNEIINEDNTIVSNVENCDNVVDENTVVEPINNDTIEVSQTTNEEKNNLICEKCQKTITEKVSAFSIEKYGKPLCMSCQKEEK